MAVKFIPTDKLDISTDPTLLPATVSGKMEVSGAMTRCKNLHLDDVGLAKTRYGSRKLNQIAVGSGSVEFYSELFVGVGTGTNKIGYSSNGSNWKEVTNSEDIFSVAGYGVAWNGTVWVAVGEGTANTIAISYDGKNWTGLGTDIFSLSGRSVAWNGTRFIAVGNGTNTIAYSADGISWTPVLNSTNIFSTIGYGVAWNGTRFVATGSGTNTLAYSADGISWTGIGTSIFGNIGYGVAWNGTRFVATGEVTNTIAYSTDGISWTGIGTAIFSTIGYGVAWNGTRFVATGSGTNTIAYSTDGISWTGIGTAIFSSNGFGASWNGSIFVAVGNGTNTIAHSADGISWTGIGATIFSTAGYGVASAPAPELIPNVEKIKTTRTEDIVLGDIYNLAEMNGDRYLFAGTNIYKNETIIETGLSQADWEHFIYTAINSDKNSIFTLNGVDRKRIIENNVYEWGIDAPTEAPMISGIDYIITADWEADNLPAGSSYRKFTETKESSSTLETKIAYANTWVAGGSGTNTLASSLDGISWTGRGASIFTDKCRGVAWNGSIFVAVGSGGNSIAYSEDGITWEGLGTDIFSSFGHGIAWNGRLFVAVGSGNNSIAYSADGKTWTGIGKGPFSSYGKNLAWNGSMFVAVGVGTNTLAYSADGISWTGLGTSIFGTFGQGIAWNGSLWVAGGGAFGVGNSLAYSYDGINWTGLGDSIFASSGDGVAWNGSIFVAVGSGFNNSLAYSYDGINWTGLGRSIFSSASSGGVAWNGTRFVATGSSANTIAYSADGISWTGIGATIFSTAGYGIASAPAPKLIPAINGVPTTVTTGIVDGYDYIYPWELHYADIEDYPNISTDTRYGTYDFETASSTEAIKAKYTYCRKTGTVLEAESNPSPEATSGDSPINGINVTWTVAPDSQVTHVRIYRTLAEGSTFFYDSEYEVATNNATLSKPDTALGSEVETNHDRPPLGLITTGPSFNGYCFILKDNKLYYCLANRPEYWPTEFFVEVGSSQFELKAIAFYNGVTYVMNKHEIFLIQGSGATSFFPFNLSSSRGGLSQKTVLAIKGQGIFRVHTDGIWLYSETEDKRITENNFSPIFKGESKGTIPAINLEFIDNSWLFYSKNKLYFGYPGGDATQPNNILVLNLQTEKTAHYDYSKTFAAITTDKTNNRILAMDTEGFVWEIENKSLTEDAGTTISWEVESKSFSDSLHKYFPRMAKYDVELDSTASATGKILLNDEVIQEHTLVSRNTKRRLIKGSTGDRLGIRISGSGVASIRQVEVE